MYSANALEQLTASCGGYLKHANAISECVDCIVVAKPALFFIVWVRMQRPQSIHHKVSK